MALLEETVDRNEENNVNRKPEHKSFRMSTFIGKLAESPGDILLLQYIVIGR